MGGYGWWAGRDGRQRWRSVAEVENLVGWWVGGGVEADELAQLLQLPGVAGPAYGLLKLRACLALPQVLRPSIWCIC